MLEQIAAGVALVTSPGAAKTRALHDLERAGLVEVEIAYKPTEAGCRLLVVWEAHRAHEQWAQQTLDGLTPPSTQTAGYQPPDPHAPWPWACWRWDGTEQGWTRVATGQQAMMEAEVQRRMKVLAKMGQSGIPHRAAPADQPPDPPPVVNESTHQGQKPDEPDEAG